jgi:MerR family transcriptional regulator, light-induced transcriptional regulator
VFCGAEACLCSNDLPNVRLLKTLEEKKAFLVEDKRDALVNAE